MIKMLANQMLGPFCEFFKSASNEVENAVKSTSDPLIPTISIALLLYISSFFGIRFCCLNASSLLMFSTPLLTKQILNTLLDWESQSAGVTRKILEFLAQIFRNFKIHIFISMFVVLLGSFIIGTLVKNSVFFIYGLFIICYYKYVVYPSAADAYFDIKSFLSIVASLPIVFMIFYSKNIKKFTFATLFGFSGCIGLLRVILRAAGIFNRTIDENIIDDFFHINPFEKNDSTLIFTIFMLCSLFTQYSSYYIYKVEYQTPKKMGKSGLRSNLLK